MENEKKYSVIELAELLGVPRTTINDWLSKYSSYIDYAIQGKRRVYPESAVTVLKEISSLRNSGMSSADIEFELAKRHPVRAVPESPETAADSSTLENTGDRTAGSTAPASKSDLPAKENEFQLIARRQSEELGKMIGETFRDMAQRMEELERLHRAQGRRAKLWMAVAALILLLLLFGTFFGYRSHRQLLSVSRANTELKQETASANRQLQELQRQSVELIAGTEKFRSNITLLEKQLKEQKEIFDRDIGIVRRDFEKAAAAHQSQLAAEKEKNAALLKMKDAELALEKEKFAAERLKFLRDIERMSSDNENIVRDLKRQMDQRNTDQGKQLPEDMK